MGDLIATPQPEIPEKAGLPAARYCLVIEPEAALQQNYGAALVAEDFNVVASHSISAVLTDKELIETTPPVVMLVAVNDYVGYHEPRLQRLQQQLLCLRKQWPLSSLIILADGTPSRWLHALAVDDLLPKVAPLSTIMARCQQAAVRFSRRQPDVKQSWQKLFDNIEDQNDAGLIRVGGQRPRLTLSEYAVLACLLKTSGERRSYAALSKEVGYPADPLSLMALMQALQLRFIETFADVLELVHITHYGYQLNMLIKQAIDDEAETSNESLAVEHVGLPGSATVGQER